MTAASSSPSDLVHTREFFRPRAAGWDERFPDDAPVYAAAVAAMGTLNDAVVLDAGCGTARAVMQLREAVGPGGLVIGADATPEMLAAAVSAGRASLAALVLTDTAQLPLPDGAVHGVFAAGLLPHVPDAVAALRELARVTRRGGCVAIFHPVGRAALAARQGRELSPHDVLDPANIGPALQAAGWVPESIEDSDARYLVLARR
ncbi:MAG TPA: methyltransferase domain-containing protein [Acidimicrobiia bacterium]|nr:methyltransferase domain-containing protein [Acidimicrobiia bacterium]